MKTTKRLGIRPYLLLWVVLIAGVIGAEGALGQFYGFYGDHVNLDERGFNRVIPVTQCVVTDSIVPGPGNTCNTIATGITANGYIAVGYTSMSATPPGAFADVYVVRTNNWGNTVWEKTYDIGNNQMNDTAFAVVELAQPNPQSACFAIVGTSEQVDMAGFLTTDIFVLLIDNVGAVIATSTFDAGRNEYGRDIIQAQHQFQPQPPPVPPYPGNPAPVPSMPGDLVFCGWTDNGPGGTDDGVILRTDLNLIRAWDIQYDLPPVPGAISTWDRFYALTESRFNVAPVPRNGDILVAGYYMDPGAANGSQGLVGRVQGFNGQTAGPGTGFGDFGGMYDEEFNSIIELRAPGGMGGPRGNAVAVGRTNSPSIGGFWDIYMVDLAMGDPCTLAGDVYFGDPGIDIDNHVGMCVREILVPGLMIPSGGVGNLLVTGYTDINGGDDVLLASVAMPGLIPAPFGFLYGDFGPLQDRGISLADVPAAFGRGRGVIMCGFSDGAYNTNHCPILPANASEDLFLVKTDNMGNATMPCTQQWDIQWQRNLPNGCLDSVWVRPFIDVPRQEPELCWDTDTLCCTVPGNPNPKPAIPGSHEDLSRSMIQTRPNPVKGGQSFNLTVAPTEPSAVEVTVTNLRGEEVYRTTLPEVKGATEIQISTDGWPSGAYLLKATDGRRIDAMRVNVLE